ncbi:FMN-binding negative transcriptional regulator [Variovorax sp. LT1R16]|uniref:FMN-binding negative transcriptional regulator n=1 Tax=Variovorax sp. LT1R16 TaxID=3443728 RepID=UPI003F476C43
MYLPKYHQFTDQEAVLALIEAHPLGAWVCHNEGELIANHVPFILDRSRGPHGTLMGHVSRANGVWRALTPPASSVVMFRGPQAYISPGWYPSKTEHGEVVPTWNYVVAHAHGVARAIEDPDWILGMLEQLTHAQESGRPKPWQVSDAPAHYVERMLRAIVGIEIPIERLEGKLKVSQDEALQDRIGTVAGLQAMPGDEARALAGLVEQAIDRNPPR